ncbi:MAG: single-stranded-DNA-specific exonuclease RecJ, partial [Candidatus Moraniibacteriota bacterium]
TKKDVDDFFASDYDKNLHDPFLFSAMHRVVERVQQAKEKGEKIGIFGDHDADGVSSATVLAEGLEELGFSVSVYIPDKMTEGHGINTTAIDQFVQEGVTLLFSVDCGTSNVDAVAYANDKKIDVIITDHHHAPEVLPDAFAIINPQLPRETYPFKELSGTAVAFKVVQALFTACAPERVEQLKWLLDVVCVGTIADCMPLFGENRVLVKYGLIVLSKTRRKGYQKLISVGNIPINRWSVPTADVIAFQIAPRINAAGRMSHAKHAYALLREKDDTRATKKAQDIEKQNRDRQRLVAKIVQDVEDVIRTQQLDNNAFIVASSKDYPIGIVGIVAGRIAEKYQKPTGIFTEDGDMARGSFRSVDGVHVVDVLQSCEKYLDKYGGHEKAAGATLKTKHLPDFA